MIIDEVEREVLHEIAGKHNFLPSIQEGGGTVRVTPHRYKGTNGEEYEWREARKDMERRAERKGYELTVG
ncbi:MAG: hypothetical protein ACLFTQ_00350 [Candidatus Aenigmatarchaeota archaeon]